MVESSINSFWNNKQDGQMDKSLIGSRSEAGNGDEYVTEREPAQELALYDKLYEALLLWLPTSLGLGYDIIKDTERETEGFTKGSSKVIEPRNSDFENLSSSLGKIRSVSVALLPGKLILRRILEQQNQEIRNFTTWKKKIVLNDQSHQNLLWWKNQLGHKNGKAFISEKAKIEGTWNAEEINWSINLKELKSIYYAVKKPNLMTKHTSFLYPETERNSFIKPFRTGGNNLDSLHQLQNSSKNRLPSYHNQPYGCTIFYGTSNRMVFNKQNFQEDRQEVGNPQCESICYKDKKEDIPIHVQGGAKENRKIKNGADTGNTPLKKFSLVFNGS
ncbi:hypothetical protein BB559_007484 [Furculomyces boomerangus]|uniref:Uncharacterized protein n=1 Tax=Furculomyces boomerangus TaxID=61424 RepID=A0A2T9XX64_9FUNG|nr:hypothetical protein BB559_007484 [Furculomyces boomerangus]